LCHRLHKHQIIVGRGGADVAARAERLAIAAQTNGTAPSRDAPSNAASSARAKALSMALRFSGRFSDSVKTPSRSSVRRLEGFID
jgi:hypothetical protein